MKIQWDGEHRKNKFIKVLLKFYVRGYVSNSAINRNRLGIFFTQVYLKNITIYLSLLENNYKFMLITYA